MRQETITIEVLDKGVYMLEELNSMHLTKRELAERMNLKEFDYALPQQWLDTFVSQSGLPYDLVRSTTFATYKPGSAFCVMKSGCKEVQDKIEELRNV